MVTVIATYHSPTHRGIVRFTREEEDGDCWYDAYWSSDFFLSLRLGDGSAWSRNLFRTYRWVKDWDPKMKRMEDLGQYPLFARQDSSGLAVAITKDHGCEQPILAKDVPEGTFLVWDARYFFEYWLGKGAVKDRILLTTTPQESK